MSAQVSSETMNEISTLIGASRAALEGAIPDRYCDGGTLALILTQIAHEKSDNLTAKLTENEHGNEED